MKSKRMYTLVHNEMLIDEACMVLDEITEEPTTRNKTAKFCSVMASTRDSDSRNSGPNTKTPGRGWPDDQKDLIPALQRSLERSRARRSLALEQESIMGAGPADKPVTPVIQKQKKPPMTAEEKHEKTVKALRTGLGSYWEGRGKSIGYES